MLPAVNRNQLRLLLAGLCALLLWHQFVVQPALAGVEPGRYAPPIEHPLTLPSGRELGWVMGIDIDRNGRDIWVLDTCGGELTACTESAADPVMKFNASGKFVSGFGRNLLAHPHGLYIDPEGNVWIVDGFGAGPPSARGHQVFKFRPDGTLLMALGTPGVTGRTAATFNAPSDVVVARNGDIFVADGHGGASNDRIVKFSKDGRFLMEFGAKGKGPGQFENTHSLALDSSGRLFVADRGNDRIQIFDQQGRFLDEWRQFGTPSEIFIDRNDTMYVADSQSGTKVNPQMQQGIYIGSARDGRITTFIPDRVLPRQHQELVTVDGSGAVWTGFTVGRMIHKYVPRR